MSVEVAEVCAFEATHAPRSAAGQIEIHLALQKEPLWLVLLVLFVSRPLGLSSLLKLPRSFDRAPAATR